MPTPTPWPIEFHVKIDLPGLDRNPRLGRTPYDGYLRGCGIQYGNVPQLCRADPTFRAANALANNRTLVTPQNLMNLFLLLKFHLPTLAHGHIAEFGSYKGGSALFLAAAAKALLPNTHVYAFDTYAGMPPTDRAVDLHTAGEFGDVNLDELRATAAAAGLDNLHFIQGPFEETAAPTLAKAGPIALTHIDCDIHSAICTAYDATKPHMVPGSYVVFDDPLVASCLGAFEAVESLLIQRDRLHAEQIHPHMVFRYPPLN